MPDMLRRHLKAKDPQQALIAGVIRQPFVPMHWNTLLSALLLHGCMAYCPDYDTKHDFVSPCDFPR